jgi:dTDP-4-amino-4,6-dideoxygalactose transaminase
MNNVQVPFLDLTGQHKPHMAEFVQAFQQVVESSAFAGGRFVDAFEKEFAAYCGASHAVGVGNGTDALWFALLALGVGRGDEVITVPHTFIATTEAISFCGATPVFVDIEETTYTMDPARLEQAITPRTKAIIPVHIFGQCADMDPILEIARRHGIPVVEDAAQAQGALHQGRKAGSMGVAGCFSFYPGKNLGAFGEAGAVVTSDEELARKMRVLRDHGQTRKYHHAVVGWNGRMDGIQGAVLQIKLRHLDQANQRRRECAALYNDLLGGVDGLVVPQTAPGREHIFHIYAVRAQDRDELIKRLGAQGIQCGIHYPVPVHRTEAYADLGLGEGSFPVAERCANEFVSLPMHPMLTDDQVRYVASTLNALVSGAPVEAEMATPG